MGGNSRTTQQEKKRNINQCIDRHKVGIQETGRKQNETKRKRKDGRMDGEEEVQTTRITTPSYKNTPNKILNIIKREKETPGIAPDAKQKHSPPIPEET